VDGDPLGCTALYSHWPGHPPPAELQADTSTAILLRAAEDPERWLTGFDYCVNNHVDCDGLLSVAVACMPALRRHGDLLRAAAAYGDFGAWPGAAGARLALRLHQLVRDQQADGGDWQQRCYHLVASDLATLISDSQGPDDERDRQVARIEAARRDLRQGGIHRFSDRLTYIERHHHHGHHADGPTTVDQADDLPPWALSGLIPADHFQLLCFHDDHGWRYHLDAPRHSWALTVDLPMVPWPDLGPLADELSRLSTSPWCHGDEARARAFTCLLASGSSNQATPCPLSPRLVAEHIAAAL
jgi:hypothetical protein